MIRNDASDLFFFGYLAGRPMKGDGSTSIAIVYHILSRFLSFTGAIADIHIKFLFPIKIINLMRVSLMSQMKRLLLLLSLMANSKISGISKGSLFWNWILLKIKFLGGLKGPKPQISLFGKKFCGLDQSSLNYLFEEIFLKGEYIFKSTKAEPVIFDCGSNIGMGILFFKIIYPNAKITGFEANPEVFEILKTNISNLNMNDIQVHHLALYDQDTEITFYTGNSSESLLGSINSNRGGKKAVLVKAKKLSEFLKTHSEIDLIKIDVEGAEWNIIQDLVQSSSLRKCHQYLIEFHLNLPELEGKLSEFLEYFEAQGYLYNIRGDFGRVGEFQDLLIQCIRKD
ncbi:MAG: FkbM family methyltransferase [Algoriphagus sp.]